MTEPPLVGPFFECPECGERYLDWHMCADQRERARKWESKAKVLDYGTQGSTLDAYTRLEWALVDLRHITAQLQAVLDAMEQERRDAQPTKDPAL